MEWTTEKVAALATDAGTENRGKKLATTTKWRLLGQQGQAIWGECKGSGSEPYYVKIDLQGPAFACSCPVRKLPCKHIMGLFFLFVQQGNFLNAEMPAWVQEWIQKRRDKKGSTGSVIAKAPVDEEKARKAKLKRETQRKKLMAAGVDELEQWLLDLVRQGFANVDVNNMAFWEQAAFKMKDAKLSRVSYFLKETGSIATQSDDWMEEVTARIGALYLLVRAFRQINDLPQTLQEEILNTLGRTVKKADVLSQSALIQDQWLILAKKEEMDLEGVQGRRVWLQGIETKEQALILDYAFGNMGFEQQYVVGGVLEGTIAYYPAAYPLRAVLNQAKLVDFEVNSLPVSSDSIEDFQTSFATLLNHNPWLLKIPVIIEDVLPFRDEKNNCFIKDKLNKVLPLSNLRARVVWRMLALSGGQPITIIGEWNGQHFEALSLWQANKKIEEL